MSTLKDRLRQDLTAAMKSRDALRSSTIRMALAAIATAEVAGKQARELTDDDVVSILATETKKRREAAEAFEAGGRAELAQKERDESAILADYLPEALDAEALASIIAEAITATGAETMKDMGKVMAIVTPQTKGRADGAVVAAEVRRLLA